jgi:TonB-dependent receptor
MRLTFCFYILFFVSIACVNSIFGQTTYHLKGTISDSASDELLPGAAIKINDTESWTISDLNGDFNIKNIKQEKIQLHISYVGYQTKEVTVFLPDFVNQKFHLKLKPVSTKLEQVEVKAVVSSQVKALMDQMNAENIKNVISAKQIAEFPDVNAAETLQRIPGVTLQRDKGEGRFVQLRGTPPEYTNFNINGEQIPSPEGGVRFVGLDVISSDQVEFIEVSKVLTPDMDADAIGGSVNIITKMARSSQPEIGASFSGGYSNLRGTNNYQGQFSFSQRTGKFGFSMSANYYLNNQGADNMEFQYIKGPLWGTSNQEDGSNNYHVLFEEFQLRHYNITRKRVGLNSTFDYQVSPDSKFYIRGMYNRFSDHETRRRVIYTLEDAVTENYYLYGGVERDLKDRTKIQGIGTVNIGGEHSFNRIDIDYECAYALASMNTPDYLTIAFDNPGQAIYTQIDIVDDEWPVIVYPNPDNASNATNYAEYEFDELRLENSEVIDENLTAKANMKFSYLTNFGMGYFKFGGKARQKVKERDIGAQIFTRYFSEDVPGHTGTAPENLLTELYDGFAETNLLNQNYVVDYVPSPNLTRDFLEYYPQHFYLNKNDTKDNTFSEDYKANEFIYAGYGMFCHTYKNLMILGGARYEFTQIDYLGNKVIKDRRGNFESLTDSTDQRENSFFLPQIQLKYTLNNRTNIRAAITKTFSRPNFEDVLPYKNEERDNIDLGNPDLAFPVSINIDLLGEKYGMDGSVISGGLFYKKIDKYIYYYRISGYSSDPSSGGGLKRIEVPLNGNRAFVYGTELLSQFKFKILPGFLSNFGLYLNYTYTLSEAYINQRYSRNEDSPTFILGESFFEDLYHISEEEKIPLPGQARHNANLALFYDSDKIYLKISANYHDRFLNALGEDSELDEYYSSAWHLDLTMNYSVNQSIKVFADCKNLTNAPLKHYLGNGNRMLKNEYYSWWMRLGVKLNIKGDKNTN